MCKENMLSICTGELKASCITLLNIEDASKARNTLIPHILHLKTRSHPKHHR